MKFAIAVVLLAGLSLAGGIPVQLISKQTVSYQSKAQFPVSSPQLRRDVHDHRLVAAAVGDVHLLLLAGPSSDMMSYQVDTLKNPEIRLPHGSRLTLNVVNVDDDMMHDLFLTTLPPPYPAKVSLGTLGTAMLKPYKGKLYSGAVLILKATAPGTLYYVCTVPGHAKAGMYGKIVVAP